MGSRSSGERSRFRGVWWESSVGRWAASIRVTAPRARTVRIARFDSETEAACAYDRVVLHIRGPSASRNFPRRSLDPASIDQIRAEQRQRRKMRTSSRLDGVYRKGAKNSSQARPWVAELRLPSGQVACISGFATERQAGIARDRALLFYGPRGRKLRFAKEAQRLGPASVASLRADRERARKSTTTSRYRGVIWASHIEKWRARIRTKGTLLDLGLFDDEDRAAAAYDAAALGAFGTRAKLNFGRTGLMKVER